MLTLDDKKEIRNIVKEEVIQIVEEGTESLRASLVAIEQKLPILDGILDLVRGHSEKLSDHEERITVLETQAKVS